MQDLDEDWEVRQDHYLFIPFVDLEPLFFPAVRYAKVTRTSKYQIHVRCPLCLKEHHHGLEPLPVTLKSRSFKASHCFPSDVLPEFKDHGGYQIVSELPFGLNEDEYYLDNRKDFVLYRFFDRYGNLLYIGQSISIAQRIGSHRHDKKWWKEVVGITLERGFINQIDVTQAERDAIIAESPRYNVTHNASGG